MLSKILDFVKARDSELILAIAIVCITIISFNLGRASMREQGIDQDSTRSPTSNLQKNSTAANSAVISLTPKDPTVVASKASSSKLYHFTYCSGAARITAKNKISFPNEEAAISAGYSLAGNCQK